MRRREAEKAAAEAEAERIRLASLPHVSQKQPAPKWYFLGTMPRRGIANELFLSKMTHIGYLQRLVTSLTRMVNLSLSNEFENTVCDCWLGSVGVVGLFHSFPRICVLWLPLQNVQQMSRKRHKFVCWPKSFPTGFLGSQLMCVTMLWNNRSTIGRFF